MTAPHPGLGQAALPSAPPVDPPTGVHLGGVGTGFIELLQTGRPGTVAFGHAPQRLIGPMTGTFFGLRWADRFRLLQLGGQDGQPGVEAVDYQGRHPVATCTYAIADCPLAIQLTAFAPLVPHRLDLSDQPGAVFAFRLRNLGPTPLPIELSFSWENVCGIGAAGRRGMALLADRTGARITAFAPAPDRGGLGFSVPDRGENHHARSALAAVAPAGWRLVTWAFWNALGEAPELLAALAAGRRDARFDAGDLAAVAALLHTRTIEPPSWDDPDPRHGGGRAGLEGMVHPAGVLALVGALAPDAEVVLPFAVAWHAPHHRCLDQPGTDHGRQAARHGPPEDLALRLLAQWPALLDATQTLFHQLARGDLPDWLVDKLLNDSTPLTTNSVVTADGVLHTLESTPMMFGALGTLDQRLVSQAGMALLFPELDRTELLAFAGLQADNGSLPHFTGNHATALRFDQVEYGHTGWPDLTMSFIIQAFRDACAHGDPNRLVELRPAIDRAARFLIAADRDGDGIPEGGSSWDTEHFPGCFIATATLHLATLRVLQELASRWGDGQLAGLVAAAQPKAMATVAAMWRPEGYFRAYFDPRTGHGSDHLFIGQLEGEWVVRQLGLAPVLPPAQALAAARTCYQRNADPGRYRLAPIHVQADGSPRLTRRYWCQAWPQYTMSFLDCPALYLGLVDEALANLARFDRVVCQLQRSPWATTLWHDGRTGLHEFRFMGRDHYMNGPAIWWVLSALTGICDDAWAGRLTLGPVIWPGRTSGCYPVVTSRWWGRLEWERRGADQRITLQVDRLHQDRSLSWNGLRWRGRLAAARHAGRLLPLHPAEAIYTDLDLPLTLAAGETCVLELTTDAADQ